MAISTPTPSSPLFLFSPSFHTSKTTHKSKILSHSFQLSYNNNNNNNNNNNYQPPISNFTLSNQATTKLTQNPYQRLNLFTKKHRNLRVLAVEESAEQIVSVTENADVTSTVITLLLSLAFLALTVLTIGVIYISVTDFLTKREKEKFEKEEEEAKKKKGGKKVRARSRAGPRGFGQKIDVDEDDD